MRVVLCMIIIQSLISVYAGDIALTRFPEKITGICSGSPAIGCSKLAGSVIGEGEISQLIKEFGHAQNFEKLLIPPVELGFFCLFELRLEKKLKFPVNFELK